MANTVHEKETVDLDGRNGYNTSTLQLHKSIQCTKYDNSRKKKIYIWWDQHKNIKQFQEKIHFKSVKLKKI